MEQHTSSTPTPPHASPVLTLLPRQAAARRTADSSSSRFRGDQTIPQNVRLLRGLLPRSPACAAARANALQLLAGQQGTAGAEGATPSTVSCGELRQARNRSTKRKPGKEQRQSCTFTPLSALWGQPRRPAAGGSVQALSLPTACWPAAGSATACCAAAAIAHPRCCFQRHRHTRRLPPSLAAAAAPIGLGAMLCLCLLLQQQQLLAEASAAELSAAAPAVAQLQRRGGRVNRSSCPPPPPAQCGRHGTPAAVPQLQEIAGGAGK